jgi:hypothetical protein
VKAQVRVTGFLRLRMQPDHVLEVDDRRIVSLPLQVVVTGLVILDCEPLIEFRDLLIDARQQR